MNIAHTLFAFVVSVTFAATGQAQIQNFKSGTYRGTMVVTTSIDDVGQTSATLKIAGRSAGDTVLKLIGTPQLALPLLNNAGDDYPIKTFSIEPSPVGESMSLYEVINTGFQKGTTIGLSLDSLIVKGNVVRGELSYSRTLNVLTNFKIKLRLTRVGN